MIVFNSPKHKEEYQKVDSRLTKMILVMDFIAQQVLQEPELLVTSVYRNDPKSAHSRYGAVDFSVHHFKHGEVTGQFLREVMNGLYIYDPNRPHKQVIPTLWHGETVHLHIQWHPNTTSISGARLNAINTILTADRAVFNQRGVT